jgi:DNA-binding transcriptional LysR family regulator
VVVPWDLRHIRVFIAVSENLHFGKAAQSLHIAQSAVSRTIRWMEQDLKVPLLNRNTRNVALTPEGTLLLHECRQIVAQFDKSIKRTRSISAGLAGDLDVGCNDFAFLAELPIIVRLFSQRFPNITIRLHEGQRSEQLAAMSRGDLDVSFVIGPVNLPEIATVTTGSYPLTALISNNHPLAQRKKLRIRDLANERFIFGSRVGWEAYRGFLDSIFDAAEFDPNIVLETYGSVGLFGLVAAGLGVSIYPDCQLQVQYRNLTVRPLVDVTRWVETAATWYPQTLTRVAEHFVAFLKEYCSIANGASGVVTRMRERAEQKRKPLRK